MMSEARVLMLDDRPRLPAERSDKPKLSCIRSSFLSASSSATLIRRRVYSLSSLVAFSSDLPSFHFSFAFADK